MRHGYSSSRGRMLPSQLNFWLVLGRRLGLPEFRFTYHAAAQATAQTTAPFPEDCPLPLHSTFPQKRALMPPTGSSWIAVVRWRPRPSCLPHGDRPPGGGAD